MASAQRFAWLLGQGPAPHPPGGIEELDAARTFALGVWRALPLLTRRVDGWAGPDADRSTPAARRLADARIAMGVFSRMQRRIFGRVVAALAGSGLPHALVKGSAARLWAYDGFDDRVGHDLDLAVRPRDARAVERVVRREGFDPAQWVGGRRRFAPVDPAARRAVEAEHYELGFLVRCQRPVGLDPDEASAVRRHAEAGSAVWFVGDDGRPACYTSIDVHHGLSLDIGTEGVLAEARRFEGPPFAAPIASPAWLAFHLIFKLYWEGVTHYRAGLHQYVDLARVVPRLEPADVEALFALVDRYAFEAGTYYVLRRFESDLKQPLPPTLARFVRSQRAAPAEGTPETHNDRGDHWPKCWGEREPFGCVSGPGFADDMTGR